MRIIQKRATNIKFQQDNILSLLQDNFAKFSHATAVYCSDQPLSYLELDKKSNQLARYIQTQFQQTKSETNLAGVKIAVCMPRGCELIVAFIAILKLNAIYVPIDPDFPEERISFILKNSEAKFVLAEPKNITKIFNCHPETFCLSVTDSATESSDALNLIHTQDDAYIIYTSGTTGQPKGVLVGHAALHNLINTLPDIFQANSQDCFLLIFSPCFDASIFEILSSLIVGACLYPVPSDARYGEQALAEFILQHQITKATLTPSILQTLDAYQADMPQLNTVVIAGEKPNKNLLEFWLDKIKLINAYGPSEYTICTSYRIVRDIEHPTDIGRPIANTKLYILNENFQLVQNNEIGELYIAGRGLAKGYVNNPAATEKAFIDNPFLPGTKLYRTGDLVRYIDGNTLEYIERRDNQVKIRGFRVELSEIEAQLLQFVGILQAIATYSEEWGICAYVQAGINIADSVLREFLQNKLPEYMLPNHFITIAEIPLTVNGKVDKKALPEPTVQQYAEPSGEYQTFIANLWQTLLPHVKQCGQKDNFFLLGGHSLLITKIILEIKKKFQVILLPKQIFENSDLDELAEFIERTVQKNQKSKQKYNSAQYQFLLADSEYAITKPDMENQDQPFPLTNVQQAYLYGRLGLFELGATSTHIYFELIFKAIDLIRFEHAFNILLARHSSLRLTFQRGEQCVQPMKNYVIKDHGPIQQTDLLAIRDRLSHIVYDPAIYPLFDIEVSRYQEEYIVHFSMDALLMDVASFDLFFKEWAALYNNPTIHLPTISLQFRDYVLALQKLKTSQYYQEDKTYWQSQIAHYDFEAALPLRISPHQIKYPKFSRITKTIDKKIWQKLQEKIIQHSLSPTSVILACYGMVLAYWSGKTKFCINLTLFNRLSLHPEMEKITGDFTILELFNFIRSEKYISQLLTDTHHKLWADLDHRLLGGIEFQRLVRKTLHFDNTRVLAPIVLTSALGMPFTSRLQFDGVKTLGYEITQTSQAYLDHKAYEKAGALIAEWDYVEQLFEPAVIQQMHTDYCNLIEFLADNHWDQPFLAFQPSAEDCKFINAINTTEKSYASDTLLSVFEKQAELSADRIAVIDGKGQVYNYGEINHCANNLAKQLHIQGAKPNQLIGIFCEKGFLQVVGVYGILKSGAAYLPLSNEVPVKRISEILSEGLAQQVIVSRNHWEKIKDTDIPQKYAVTIIEDAINVSVTADIDLKTLAPKPEDIAYVIFTSGSTGKPKGVTIAHRGAINTIQAVNAQFNVNAEDKILAVSGLVFDLSVYDIFGLLAVGGAVVFPDPEQTKNPAHWHQLINQHHITIWNTVPQLMELLTDYVEKTAQNFNSIRFALLSGDWIPFYLPLHIRNYAAANAQIISLGGATEGSIWSVWYEIDKLNPEWLTVPYGTPMPNQKAYILNELNEECPLEVFGEICLGGIGVAEGYWQNPEKTAASFFIHPTLGRLYRTGDLGRWRQMGFIELLGRKDTQVKLNGYRVELGEIEAKIAEIFGIQEVLVRVQTKNSKQILAAYLVLADIDLINQEDLNAQIIEYLATILPTYMIPSVYFFLTKLPLTPNGKVDYQALSRFEIDDRRHYQAPSNDLEIKLCEIFAKILNCTQVSTNENFFQLGGDSLLAIRVVTEINLMFNCKIEVKDIFVHKTVEKIAEQIAIADKPEKFEKIYSAFSLITEDEKAAAEDFCKQANLGNIVDIYPAAYLQKGMLSDANRYANSVYHNVVIYEVRAPFEQQKFLLVWEQLIANHELLRVGFINYVNHGYLAIVYAKLDMARKYHFHLIDDSQIEKIFLFEQHKPLDISQPGLFRLNIQQDPKALNKFNLIFTIHHAIADGWSEASLLAEFIDAYIEENPVTRDISLPYGQYIQNEQQALRTQQNFWQDYLANYEYQQPHFRYREKNSAELDFLQTQFNLDADTNQLVLSQAHRFGVSADTIFLAVYIFVLAKFLNRSDLVIGTVVNNRIEDKHGDTLFGLFLNTIPFRMHLNNAELPDQFIQRVFAEKVNLQNFKAYPYGKIKSDVGVQTDLYSCAFNYVNFHVAQKHYAAGHIKLKQLHGITNIPLILTAHRNGDTFQVSLEGHTTFIDQKFLLQLKDNYHFYLQKFLQQSNIHGLSKKDAQLIAQFGGANVIASTQQTLHQLFEFQAEHNPNNIAVEYEHQQLNYSELNARANQLARGIQAKFTIRCNAIIGILVDPSINMLIAMLAILKLGAAYLPLDPNYPDSRIKAMLDDAETTLILINQKYRNKLSLSADVIALDDMKYVHEATHNLNLPHGSLAYLMYTSGTTGKPKGVMIEHQSVVDLALHPGPIQILSSDVFIQLANPVFDAATFEIWCALGNGAKLIIPTDALTILANLNDFTPMLQRHQVTTLWLTKTLFDRIFNFNPASFASLKYLIVGGEKLNAQLITKLMQQEAKPKYVVNGYGPTETTVFSTMFVCDVDSYTSVPIGRPLPKRKIYILNANLNPVPIGAVGEIYISGGLATGYWKQPELSAKAFIVNPFASNKENSRLYKTGDLARWLPDGNIEYIARADNQIKLRGFRIEINEIEQNIQSYPGIQQCAVVLRENTATSMQFLACFYVSDETISEDVLSQYLAQRLPEYMIPSFFITLPELPMTKNGKLDLIYLKNIDLDINRKQSIAPRNSAENDIAEIWQQLFSLENIGVSDDFFRLGGNSLLMLDLKFKLEQKFNKNIVLSDLYKYSGLAEQAQFVQQQSANTITLLNDQSSDHGQLFLIHTARGSAEVYRDLAVNLSLQTFGVESYNLYTTTKPILDIDKLADYYTQEMLKWIQPNKKLYIGGWSFGGLVAAKIRQRIIRYLNNPIQIILFDALTPDYFQNRERLQQNSDWHHNLRRYGHTSNNQAFVQKLIEVGDIHDQMAMNCKLTRDHYDLLLIKAEENQLADIENQADYRWSQYTTGTITIQYSRGNHETMFDRPYLHRLADIIKNYIEVIV